MSQGYDREAIRALAMELARAADTETAVSYLLDLIELGRSGELGHAPPPATLEVRGRQRRAMYVAAAQTERRYLRQVLKGRFRCLMNCRDLKCGLCISCLSAVRSGLELLGEWKEIPCEVEAPSSALRCT